MKPIDGYLGDYFVDLGPQIAYLYTEYENQMNIVKCQRQLKEISF